ncbi:ankyrin repeat domain-containing protein [Ramlibacter ginsenosidimutans]|uniref:Ankyrin repeat domain-containing protein n=1 Tax=Ramlibacter ginsenosidimutans TaxID=502333 RepID=A0A934TUP0_9BURK|nr:ankyrin repeat domain-containing protein [Ramlibacter ginsenosidimutans]
MRNRIRFIAALVLAFALPWSWAGSYDDFFVAITRDDPQAVTELLQRGFDANTVDPKGRQGLFLALQLGSLKAADVLIAWPKTQVEWRSAKDESPLMIAAFKGYKEQVRKLIARDADVNKPGWTPLHYAATAGHVDIIALLLDENAYIDAESPNKTTPLMMAAMYGSTAAVRALLEAGADPTLRNQLGLSAVDFAQRGKRPDAAELIAAAIRNRQPRGKW